jgi:hypothetical protein|tara:strand:- start:307 stop:435 length:129 start_codon:yes stop_codon:yes gene_type:complete
MWLMKIIGVLLIVYTGVIYILLQELNKIKLEEPWEDWEGDEI